MTDDRAKSDGYSTVHVALHALRTHVITFEEFMSIIKTLRRDLEQDRLKVA